MSKEVKEDDEESSRTKSNWSYDGNEDDWNTFDRRMQRFMRKKLGVFGENIWMGNIPDLNGMTPFEFDRYCMEVWKAIDCEDPSAARKLWDPTSGFWLYEYQRIWIDRQQTLMIDHIEDHAKGQVEIEIINYNGSKAEIRKHLYKQFGAGTGGDIH